MSGQPFSGTVQFDLTGDGSVAASGYASYGSFSYNLAGYMGTAISYGAHTVYARAVSYGMNGSVYGAWVGLQFTYQAPPPPPAPVVGGLPR